MGSSLRNQSVSERKPAQDLIRADIHSREKSASKQEPELALIALEPRRLQLWSTFLTLIIASDSSPAQGQKGFCLCYFIADAAVSWRPTHSVFRFD
jgi:hypothetical protein